jgi:hypothetical protein
MSNRKLAVVAGAVSIVVLSLANSDGGAQTQGATGAATEPGARNGWKVARAPWGEPDLQGIWASGYIAIPLERPDIFQGREFLTDEEVRAEEKRMLERQDHSTGGPQSALGTLPPGDPGGYNTIFSGRGREVIRTRRTSLVVDPPDGKIPWKPELRDRVLAEARPTDISDAGPPGSLRTNVWSAVPDSNDKGDGPEERPNDRCRGLTLPHVYGTAEAGGAPLRIVQSAGFVSIYYEYGPHGGAYRQIPVDGRPHLPLQIRQWLGDPRGRWEGDTLLVDTTNFTNQTNYRGSRENLHLVERFTRAAPDLIMYRAMIDDPTVFTRSWTIEVPLTKQDDKANQIFETACYEGNYALLGILAGFRAIEKEKAAKQKSR